MSSGPIPRDEIQITLFEGIHQNAVETFRAAGYSRIQEVAEAGALETLGTARRGHFVGIRSRTQLARPFFEGLDTLLGVGCFCIGTNQVDLEAARDAGVAVFNAPHANTRSVAELVMAEIVMLFRGIGDKNRDAHVGVFKKSAEGSYEVRGKRLGIVGYGHIGSQVSILAEAFGMRVLYYDIEPKLAMGNAQSVESLGRLLSEVDAVTLHVPDTAQTRGLIGAADLARMPAGSVLINASRGGVVDLEALAAAIDTNHLLGAAVDVFPKEPKSGSEPFKSPLQGKRNVILTPHIGGSTQEAQASIGTDVAQKLVAYCEYGRTIGAVGFPNLSLTQHEGAHRFLHVHRNQPGVLGGINDALARTHANIVGQHLQTVETLGYVVTDVDGDYDPTLLTALKSVPGTIRCRVVS